ncbi:MAG: 16S rRNA (guanine(966)-N(2))-methyltransferase RsmD [Oscillospiraceae bacterium]|jgi:16S rRNA (guanine(966)-N(2))-methyltransferase RsmD|nr:16S rRNA (guanine(966)-N(2))-methyltransferase RsmD [Oscillospiraceae bacterium]
MRVVSGTLRGRKLTPPQGDERHIRPTSDRVKEALFDVIQFDVEGRDVLDLFAGTGQLGIEAASRGAKSVTLVDEYAGALRLIRENLERCGLADKSAIRVSQSDAIAFLRRPGKFDIILLDPPYMTGLIEKSLETIIGLDKLKFGGIIICESIEPKGELDGFVSKIYKYGKTYLTKYTKINEGDTEQ